MAMKGGLVHRGDATASFKSLASPTGKTGKLGRGAYSTSRKGRMADPVKAANRMLRRGGK